MIAQELRKKYNPEQARWILSHARLWPLWKKKLEADVFLQCDRLALEQSTAADISRYKAKLFPPLARIADLCCGMGGDSLFFPADSEVYGLDLDPLRCVWYRHNTAALGKSRPCVQGLAEKSPLAADFALLDPARRNSLGQSRILARHLQPGPEHWNQVNIKHAGCLLKLPPGLDLETMPFAHATHFLGSPNDCREQLLLCGSLCPEPGQRGAVVVQEGKAFFFGGIPQFFSKDEEADPARWLVEPHTPLVRSHLYPNMARHLHLAPLDYSIAYLTSTQKPPGDWWTSWEIIDHCSLGSDRVEKMLKRHQMGKLTLKKRGVDIDPQIELRRLRPMGDEKGILVYGRLHGKHHAFLCSENTH